MSARKRKKVNILELLFCDSESEWSDSEDVDNDKTNGSENSSTSECSKR
jgi:hypothetical protein